MPNMKDAFAITLENFCRSVKRYQKTIFEQRPIFFEFIDIFQSFAFGMS